MYDKQQLTAMPGIVFNAVKAGAKKVIRCLQPAAAGTAGDPAGRPEAPQEIPAPRRTMIVDGFEVELRNKPDVPGDPSRRHGMVS